MRWIGETPSVAARQLPFFAALGEQIPPRPACGGGGREAVGGGLRMTSIIDTHYSAYAAGDMEGVLATLTDDYTVAPFGGKPWLTSREGARKMYARHIKTYPMDRTDVLGRIELGNVVIKREHSRPADGVSDPVADVMPIYTLRDGLMARCDSVTGEGDEAANVAVAVAQLDAYNAQDLDAHVAYFADNVVIADFNGAENLHGVEAYRERYKGVFAQYPGNHAELIDRLACANVVVDHERVSRETGGPTFDVLAIYSFVGGKIARVDFVK